LRPDVRPENVLSRSAASRFWGFVIDDEVDSLIR
jgi:hypothetical protein